MVTFGQQMKALRTTKGMTLEAVAAKVGTHKGYVSGIENGKVPPPSAKLVRRFAKIFGQPYEELLVEAELEKIHPDVREYVRLMVQTGREWTATKAAKIAAHAAEQAAAKAAV